MNLSRRQMQVLTQIAEGLGDKEIAAQLDIATSTVSQHVGEILVRLQARNRAQAVAKAAIFGILILQEFRRRQVDGTLSGSVDQVAQPNLAGPVGPGRVGVPAAALVSDAAQRHSPP